MYSSELTESSGTFIPATCDRLKYYYEAVQVNVLGADCYSLSSNSTIDIYGYIYNGTFDPFNPSQNLFLQNNNNMNGTQFKLITSLLINTTYVLVVTTLHVNVTARFSVLVSGSNNVGFNRISEYLYNLLNS